MPKKEGDFLDLATANRMRLIMLGVLKVLTLVLIDVKEGRKEGRKDGCMDGWMD